MLSYGKLLFPIPARLSGFRSCLPQLCQTVVVPTRGLQQSEKQAILPVKPKRPTSVFCKFVKDTFENMKAQYPNDDMKQITKKLARMWAELEPATKEKYMHQFRKDFAEYKIKLKEYEQSIKSAEKQELRSYNLENQKLQNIKLKQQIHTLGKPRRPKNSFLYFLQDERKHNQIPGTMKVTSKIYSKKWNDLLPEEKQKYTIQAAKDKEEYSRKVEEWERKMQEMGHIKLVRKNNQKIIKDALENESATGQGIRILDSVTQETCHRMNESVPGNRSQQNLQTSTKVGMLDFRTEKQVANIDNNNMSER